MWHASIAPAGPVRYGRDTLRLMALQALAGVGDAARGEWEEWTGYALHLRRRLTPAEDRLVGPVVDVRGTPDGRRRCARMERYVAVVTGLADRWRDECP